jgi:hypothetical protein
MHALSTGTSITQFNGDTYAVLIFDVLLPLEVGEESRAKMSLTFEVVSCHVTCQPTLGKLLKEARLQFLQTTSGDAYTQ